MPRTRGLLAFAAVWFCLTPLLGCKIQPSTNRYSCAKGEACPTGQSCGADDICRPTRCTSASDCPSEYECSAEGMCRLARCTSTADCPSGHECTDSMCTKTGIVVVIPEGGVEGGMVEPPACEADTRRCAGNVPERCEDGAWKQQDPCGGATPACTNGECAKLRLHGSIVTLTDTPAEPGKVRLVEQGLEYTQPSCGKVQGKDICLSGGIVP